ncbi:hypothetical protein SY2F82_07260 [Streptomyces sp. Y2F8-2]|uniref:hypothetical protein n=1 Tax=Streptomyces sp. Y2F8-2 TaxID=2759675 RepID=UPI001902D891|nr:hypothetical protein [Streptomyces sp. Y2F8-2]GHJ98928.1 hypothetical protein SY2F82_07260 [Streptomyces sp. Y2F8-2]
MTSAAERPVLFVDVAVDGRLIPFGSPSSRLQAPASDSEASLDQGDPLLTVWASTWMKEANEAVAPRIGLPRLPVVERPDACADDSPLSATGATAIWRVTEFAYEFTLPDDSMNKVPCVFVMRVRDGQIIESRDYIDPIRTYTARGDLDLLIASLRKEGS